MSVLQAAADRIRAARDNLATAVKFLAGKRTAAARLLRPQLKAEAVQAEVEAAQANVARHEAELRQAETDQQHAEWIEMAQERDRLIWKMAELLRGEVLGLAKRANGLDGELEYAKRLGLVPSIPPPLVSPEDTKSLRPFVTAMLTAGANRQLGRRWAIERAAELGCDVRQFAARMDPQRGERLHLREPEHV